MPKRRRAWFSSRSFSLASSTPATSTWPLVARSSPIRIRSSVVLPAPEPPITTATSLFSTRKSTPSRTTVSPKRLTSFSTRICGAPRPSPFDDEPFALGLEGRSDMSRAEDSRQLDARRGDPHEFHRQEERRDDARTLGRADSSLGSQEGRQGLFVPSGGEGAHALRRVGERDAQRRANRGAEDGARPGTRAHQER